jgi:hypothetical protein
MGQTFSQKENSRKHPIDLDFLDEQDGSPSKKENTENRQHNNSPNMGQTFSQKENSRKHPIDLDFLDEQDGSPSKKEKTSETTAMDSGLSYGGGKFSNVAQAGARDANEITCIPIVIDTDGQNDNGILTEGIMEIMDELNNSSLNPAKLCTRPCKCNSTTSSSSRQTSTVKHIQQNDSWSCGFRNLQMVLTALLPELQPNHAYFQMVQRRNTYITIPNVRQIQNALEQAWKEGYDPRGARHYKYKISGMTSKIGAIEVSSVLAYWGLDSSVVQFVTCKESRGLLSKFVQAYFSKALGKEWCSFCQGRRVKSDAIAEQLLQFASSSLTIDESCDCPLLPLYLQWEGHSITAVGTEENGSWLVFDPLKDGPKMRNTMQTDKTIAPARFYPDQIGSSDTQIVLSTFCALSYQEKQKQIEDLRVLTAATDDVMRALDAKQRRKKNRSKKRN